MSEVARKLPCPSCLKLYWEYDGSSGAYPFKRTACPHCQFDLAAHEAKQREAERLVKEAAEKAEEEQSPARSDPPGLDDVLGNPQAVMLLRMILDAHHGRGGKAAFPMILFSGPGGTGKTCLAEIIAREIKKPIRLQMGQSMNSPARVNDVLLSLKAGDVLFIDECHSLKSTAQEALYRAMEDGILVPIAKAGKPVGKPVKLPPFTLIGATTNEDQLLPSLLQRFKYRVHLKRMTAPELAQAIADRARRRGWSLDPEGAAMIGERAHGTPRLAVGLLDACMDTAIAQGGKDINVGIVGLACKLLGLDKLGLDDTARQYLKYLADGHGEPVRLNVLASRLDGIARRVVEMRIEPDLVFLGLIEKRPDGRILTPAGREHMKGG